MLVGALTWPYAINTTLSFFDKPPTAHWYHGMLIGLLPSGGYWGVIADIIVFIASFFFAG
jgi:hypothetical protein